MGRPGGRSYEGSTPPMHSTPWDERRFDDRETAALPHARAVQRHGSSSSGSTRWHAHQQTARNVSRRPPAPQHASRLSRDPLLVSEASRRIPVLFSRGYRGAPSRGAFSKGGDDPLAHGWTLDDLDLSMRRKETLRRHGGSDPIGRSRWPRHPLGVFAPGRALSCCGCGRTVGGLAPRSNAGPRQAPTATGGTRRTPASSVPKQGVMLSPAASPPPLVTPLVVFRPGSVW